MPATICPLRMLDKGDVCENTPCCLEGNCAWWTGTHCVLIEIAKRLNNIAAELEEMVINQEPHRDNRP